VTAGDQSKTYGAALPLLTYAITGFVNNESAATSITGAPWIASDATATSPVGSYTIKAKTGSLIARNYTFEFAAGRLAVNKAVITVTGPTLSMIYGGDLAQLRCKLTGLIPGDSATALSGTPSARTDANWHAAVGNYVVEVSSGSLWSRNYSFQFVNGMVTVNRAVLTVIADNEAGTYGGSLPDLKYRITGFVNGDTMDSAVEGAPLLSTNAPPMFPAGSYAIAVSPGSLAAANYAFVYKPGKLSIGKAVLTVTGSQVSMIYGGKTPPFTYSVSGLVNGDSSAAVNGYPLFHPAADSRSSVGLYSLGVSQGSLSANNYSFLFADGSISVTPAMLTVTAHNQKMRYGGTLPSLEYEVVGFENRDSLDVVAGTASCATEGNGKTAVGSYPINCSIGSLRTKNYEFLFVGGTLTVAPAVLTVTAGDKSKSYGATLPVLSYTMTGFVNAETAATATIGEALITSDASAESPVGSYAIEAAAGSLVARNYTLAFETGRLVISKAVITVTGPTMTMIYGGSLPALQCTLEGLVAGDQASVISGTASMHTGASWRASVGSYQIEVTNGSLWARNYSFQFVNGVVTVSPAVLTVVADAEAMTYGGSLPDLAYRITGFLHDDSRSASTTGTAMVSTSATTKSAVGTYPISVSAGTLAAVNYTFVFKPAALAVGPALLTLKADDLSMVMGSTQPTLTFSAAGFVNGDTVSSATTGLPTLTTTATSASAAGAYPIKIVQGTFAATNYDFKFVKGTLTITQ
jgi:hypothetical protein